MADIKHPRHEETLSGVKASKACLLSEAEARRKEKLQELATKKMQAVTEEIREPEPVNAADDFKIDYRAVVGDALNTNPAGVGEEGVLRLELSNFSRQLKMKPGIDDDHRVIVAMSNDLWFRGMDIKEEGERRKNSKNTRAHLEAMVLRTKPEANQWLHLTPRVAALGADAFEQGPVMIRKIHAYLVKEVNLAENGLRWWKGKKALNGLIACWKGWEPDGQRPSWRKSTQNSLNI